MYICFYFFSKNRRVPSEWKQWTYCKSLTKSNESTWNELTVMLSRRQHDPKFLPFLTCCILEHYKSAEDLPHLFNQFTLDEKKNIAIIRFRINFFFSVIVKFVNDLLLNLPRIKPE